LLQLQVHPPLLLLAIQHQLQQLSSAPHDWFYQAIMLLLVVVLLLPLLRQHPPAVSDIRVVFNTPTCGV
jgi:hypothetical protein